MTKQEREARTIEVMIDLYCHGMHNTRQGRCEACERLLAYARQRMAACPLRERKTTCAKCPIHCYQAAQREEIRRVMRYAGPRMILHHPILTLFHLFDSYSIIHKH